MTQRTQEFKAMAHTGIAVMDTCIATYIDYSLLGATIGITTLIILALALQAVFVDRRLSIQTELAESQRRLTTLINSLPGIVFSCSNNSSWSMAYLSKGCLELTGYHSEELLGEAYNAITHPEDLPKVLQTINAAVAKQQLYVIEYRILTKSGEEKWLWEKGSGVFDSNGEALGLEGFISDITERKRAEAALSESKRHLQEQNAVLMELARRKTLSLGGDLNAAVREITEAATNTLGIERASIWLYNGERSKIQCIDLYEWSKSHHSQGIELAAIDYPAYFQALQQERTIAAHDAQTDPRTKEFSQFYLSPLGITSMLDAPIWLGGEMVGVVCHEHVGSEREWTLEEQNFAGSIADLVSLAMKGWERKQAEEALRESEKKYRSVVDNVKEVIFQIGTAGEWLFLNRAWTEITGFSVEESIGTKFLSYVYPDERQHTLDLFQLLIERQTEHCHHEFRCLTKDGKWRWIEVYARVTLDAEGNVIGSSGTFNDITERKKVDRMKNEFVSTVSHELRTPLTSILGSLGLVTNGVAGEIPPSAKALLEIAYKNSERLVRLINDILDIEKIESGKMAFNLQPLELMPLVEQAIAANQPYGEQFRVKFVIENSLVGVKVNADSDRLMQVLTNMLSNAAKFSPPDDTVVISVSHHNQAIRVAIADHGSGIPEEFRNQIFQKFAQADSSDTRQKGGTGLGLSICKAIMEKHDGQIGFTTETNAGTTFYFDLPQWHEPAITVVDNSRVQPQLLILICEDDSDIATLLKLLLEQAGFKADIAYDAAQAKQLLAQKQYAAMTLDIALPDVDGISLLRELRQQDSTRQLPIVVVSAKAELGRQELNGNAIAVIDWLNKPIDQTRLIAAVKEATQQIGDKPRILHVEDNFDVRQVVGAILQNVADVCYAANLQEAQQKLQQEIFDLILLDLGLPDGSGLELLPQLNAHPGGQPTPPVVVFSAQEVGRETLQDVAAVLVKSRTSNQKLLETVQALTKHSSSTLVE
jgi:PAS domain S-box-containing protein